MGCLGTARHEARAPWHGTTQNMDGHYGLPWHDQAQDIGTMIGHSLAEYMAGLGMTEHEAWQCTSSMTWLDLAQGTCTMSWLDKAQGTDDIKAQGIMAQVIGPMTWHGAT